MIGGLQCTRFAGADTCLHWRLMEHPVGREVCDRMKNCSTAGDFFSTGLFDEAATEGNVDVMQFLYGLWAP
jgi:hypothetical protein